MTRFAALWLLLLAGGASAADPLVFSGPTMGTAYSVQIVSPPADLDAAAVRREVRQYLDDFDALVSTYRDDSQLSQFNAARSTEWFPVAPETAQLVQRALELAEQSGGAFDPTVAPLVQLWRFHRHEGRQTLPSEAEIAAARARVGFQHLETRLDSPALRKQQLDLEVDLNAIAPGWAVDRIAERLQARGLKSFLVDVGSELRGAGRKADGSSWRIGLERPVAGEHILQGAIPLNDLAVATSGDYRNFYSLDGIRYSHTIDPRTGRPVTHGLATVTVLAADCATADGLATTISVLGPEAGLQFAEQHGIAAWMMVRGAGDELTSRATSAFRDGVGGAMEDFISPPPPSDSENNTPSTSIPASPVADRTVRTPSAIETTAPTTARVSLQTTVFRVLAAILIGLVIGLIGRRRRKRI